MIIGAMTEEMLKQAIARELIEKAGNIQDAMSTENILAVIGARLELTADQQELIRPAVTKISQALLNTIKIWTAQSFLDRKSLSTQLAPVLKDFKTQLTQIVKGDRAEELKHLIKEFEDNSVEIIRFITVQQISKQLEMTPEQLNQLRPVLRENMATLSELIADFTTAGTTRSFEDFQADYNILWDLLRPKIAVTLSTEQIEKLAALHQLIFKNIQNSSIIRK